MAKNLTNDDFRKLLMTPREAPRSDSLPEAPPPSRNKEKAAFRQRKKKPNMPKTKSVEQERNEELAKKYRDRAKERREGANPDYENVPELLKTTGIYSAVAPEKEDRTKELKKQAIMESKFLGGDMEHTHLVKGLDYALLQKVRGEIALKEKEDDEEEEEEEEETMEVERELTARRREVSGDKVEFKTGMAKNVYRTLFQSKPPERNEQFLPGRMAYIVDLEDEYSETDIPTTLLRSKADCPTLQSHSLLSTNDIVVNKLTQILSYLRQGKLQRKGKKKEKGKQENPGGLKKLPGADINIFDDLGAYDFGYGASQQKAEKKAKQGNYFEKPKDEDEPMDVDFDPASVAKKFPSLDMDGTKERTKEFIEPVGGLTQEQLQAGWAAADAKLPGKEMKPSGKRKGKPGIGAQKPKRKSVAEETDSYAECYPSMYEISGAGYDSDEAADYSKMDMGNKKGPYKRWDFETEEEYKEYMNKKEAMPKAAFQFGVKMNDGRKTRRQKVSQKAKLDRDWQKISKILDKRKSKDGGD